MGFQNISMLFQISFSHWRKKKPIKGHLRLKLPLGIGLELPFWMVSDLLLTWISRGVWIVDYKIFEFKDTKLGVCSRTSTVYMKDPAGSKEQSYLGSVKLFGPQNSSS